MNASSTTTNRQEHIDAVARTLPIRAGLLMRLFLRHARIEITHTEAGALWTLAQGRERITELARLMGLAQPTVTLLVARLEERGWLVRERDEDDRRVVNVAITDAGQLALGELLEDTRRLLHDCLAEMPDEDVEALTAATDSLERLVVALQEAEA